MVVIVLVAVTIEVEEEGDELRVVFNIFGVVFIQ